MSIVSLVVVLIAGMTYGAYKDREEAKKDEGWVTVYDSNGRYCGQVTEEYYNEHYAQ